MTPKGSSATHSRLVRDVLEAIGSLPGVIAAPNPCGVAHYVSRSGRAFRVTYGFPGGSGGPDVLAVVAPQGRLIGLEAKTGNARTTADQRRCHAALRAVGVEVRVVRSVDEARAAIVAALSTEKER